jgi:hypothetical protein
MKITGLCGYKNANNYHMRLMTDLVKENFLERNNNRLRLKLKYD